MQNCANVYFFKTFLCVWGCKEDGDRGCTGPQCTACISAPGGVHINAAGCVRV